MTQSRSKSKRKRITITVNEETAEVLKLMAEVQKGTLSGVAGPILDGVAPHLKRMVAFLQVAKEAPKRTQAAIEQTLDRMEAEIMSIEHREVARLDEYVGKLKGEQ